MKKFFEYKRSFKFDISEDIKDFSDIYINDIAKKYNMTVIKKLGSGHYGIAYLVKDSKGKRDKVIKITTHRSEAFASNFLMEKSGEYEHFVNYYDVFEIRLKDGEEYNPVWVIIQDYVRVLTKEEKSIISTGNFLLYFIDTDITTDDLEYDILPYDDKYHILKNSEMIKNLLNQRDDIIKEANNIKFTFFDTHTDNIGFKRNGNLTFFDLGSEVFIKKKVEKTIYFENKFKIIPEKVKKESKIKLKDLIKYVSNKLKITKALAYKMIRDEVHFNHELYLTVEEMYTKWVNYSL